MNQFNQQEQNLLKGTKINDPKIKIIIKREDVSKVESFQNFQNRNNDKHLSLEDCINHYDEHNFNFLMINNSQNYQKMKNYLNQTLTKTSKDLQIIYGNQVIEILEKLNKSNEYAKLPLLPYGKALSDEQFINLLEECVSFANFNMDDYSLNYIKERLLKDFKDYLRDIFRYEQIRKDIIQNALITILTSKNRSDQKNNFDLLRIKNITTTPFISMDFNNSPQLKLDINEFKEIFCSPVYTQNYQKTLKNFIPEAHKSQIEVSELKEYIKHYFDNHYIYFCDLPENIMSVIIHTGNIYLKTKYLYEYYNEKGYESQILIREKIILNLGHELNHALLREISDTMKSNFLNTSENKNAEYKKGGIPFKSKFNEEITLMNSNDIGNLFDFNFFNNYYFDEIYSKEAELFLKIKNFASIKEYNDSLDIIIKEEKTLNLGHDPVNKFKKLGDEPVRRCIRSRILKTIKK